MSRAWRNRQKERMEELPYEPTGNEVSMSGEWDTDYGDQAYPVYLEERFVDAQNGPTFVFAAGNIQDVVDWEVGGRPGDTKGVWGEGVVNPYNVDAHDYQGQQAVIRRISPDMNGPVSTADHNSMLGLLYEMQETNRYFPSEVSQADIIKAV